jgi:gliding motility-associated-like protein
MGILSGVYSMGIRDLFSVIYSYQIIIMRPKFVLIPESIRINLNGVLFQRHRATERSMNKKLLRFFLFVCVAMLANQKVQAQGGGSNCGIALATPLGMPYSTSGTTCGAGNPFNPSNITAACLPASYLKSDEWLYYFCATRSGSCAITLNNLNPVFPDAAISVWQGCPGANNCLGANTQVVPGTLSMTLAAVQGQCYFILISNASTALIHCFSFDMTVEMLPSKPSPNLGCTNMDFGTGDFSGWFGTDGTIVCTSSNAGSPNYLISSSGLPSSQHTIMTSGTDACGAFPVVFPGANYSVMLGDGPTTGGMGGTLEQSFLVSPANAQLVYHYAVVIQNGGHQASQQPFFSVNMFDKNDLPIQCAHFLVVADSTIPGFAKASCDPSVFYRAWTAVNVDLSAYVGQAITIKFTVGDCCLGAHFAYAYVDCSCKQMTITGRDSTCAGGSAILIAPPGFSNYAWTPGGQSTPSITVYPLAQTVYTVTMSSVANTNCRSVLYDTVKLVPGPQAAFTDQIIVPNCSGGVVQFNNTSAGAISYSWNFGDSTSSLQNNPVHSYAFSGAYVVTLLVRNNLGCVDSVQQILVQNGVTASTIVSSPACSDSTGTALAIASGGTVPYTYSWHTQPPQTTSLATALGPGIYTVTVTDSAACKTDVTTMLFGPTPVAVTIHGSGTVLCAGAKIGLVANASGGSGSYQYTWSPGGLTGDTISVSPATSGNYAVLVKDYFGCPARDSILLTVAPTPLLAFSVDTADCIPYCAVFSNQSGGASSYLWTFGDRDSSFQTAPVHCYNQTGQYDITLTGISAAGCVQKLVLNKYIHVYPRPLASFSASPTVVSVFDPNVCFVNTSTGGLTQTWHFGDSWNSTSPAEKPCFKYTDAGLYCVKLNVQSDKGCADSLVACIQVKPDPVLYVPNTFTPNADGLNDVFLPRGENIDPARYQIWVFDRWGDIVWQTTEWGKGWDGRKAPGQEVLQEDTYVWKIECWDLEKNFIRQVGHITIVK